MKSYDIFTYNQRTPMLGKETFLFNHPTGDMYYNRESENTGCPKSVQAFDEFFNYKCVELKSDTRRKTFTIPEIISFTAT
jgi:hypothetical protein